MSIKARLLVAITALVTVAFAFTGVATVTVTRAQMLDRVDDTLIASAGKDPRHWDNPRRGADFGPKQSTAYLLLAPDGTVVDSDPSGFPTDPDPLPDLSSLDSDDLAARDDTIFTVGSAGGADLRYRVLLRQMPDGFYSVIAAPLDDVDRTIAGLQMVIAGASVAILVILSLVVWLVIRRGLRPVDDMIATAGIIAGGDLTRRVSYADPASEVGQLGQALNVMLGRIESSFAEKEATERRLRQFVADASHELRTPLTSIRGYAELYRSGAARSPEAVDRAMARIEAEGVRMGRLVEDLLLLARLDQGRPLRAEPVDLVRLVAHAVEDARAVEPARPLAFEHPDEALVRGDPDRLRQVVDNLLANARIHTDPRTPVRVRIDAQADDIVLTVADDGPGIAPEHAAHVFDRFYRADTSRARARGGAGLGLAIVAAIVDAHAGRVSLESAPGQGTTVHVVLPRLPRDALAPDPAEPLDVVPAG